MFQRVREVNPGESHVCHTCEKSLVAENMGPRLLERCPECRGIWLSCLQLKEILQQVSHKVTVESTEVVESDGHASIGHTFAPSRLQRKCPECADPMDNYQFEETGIWIDGCKETHGIWLDEGELRLIAERTWHRPAGGVTEQGAVLDAVSDLIIGSL